MINPQWLELPMSRTKLHGPKRVRAIEVGQYLYTYQVDKVMISQRLKSTINAIMFGQKKETGLSCV